jgi:hypothetical protein
MKKSSHACSLLAVLVSLASGSASSLAAAVAIDNPSFEDPAQASGAYAPGAPTGWSGGGGVWNPAGGVLGPVPDGNQIGFLNAGANGTITQTLPNTLLPNTIYTLSIAVGGRTDGSNPGTDYAISLLAGSTVLASMTPVIPPTGSWTTLTATYTTTGTVLPGSLQLSIGTQAGQLDFDNVKLNATPVPEPALYGVAGCLLLFGVGLKGSRKSMKARLQG